ncbi:MAG TPA: amino acid adenylation domain-containing protein, partial [Bryobacteraceae bacterium]|nr:amino acid adenylation domain-containing protein [Bryobacteraceae bacterium]
TTDACVHQLFEKEAVRSPEAVALVFEGRQLCYDELNRRANQLAHYLRQLGVRPDDRIALCLERSFEMVIALLAVWKAGGAYVPLDPDYPDERLRLLLDDAAPAALLTQTHLGGRVHSTLPVLLLDAPSLAWASQPDANPDPAAIGLAPQHLAYLIYTSGSTGTPKGVMVEHRSVVNRMLWMQSAYGLNQHDAVLQKTPYTFDVSVWEFVWPLVTGTTLVIARPEGHKDPAYLRQLIQHNQITTLHFVPSMLQVFLNDESARQCSCLRRVICSGEALSGTVATRFQQLLPDTALHNLYGPTEATVDVTAFSCPPDIDQANIPIGRPIANTAIYILDEQRRPAPIGVAGELYIGGVGVARGYLKRPEMTAERFLPDPFRTEPDARMYRTGDLGRWLPDGNIEFLGRNDFQVKIRGFRIELGEIEARLAEVGGIREALVVAREDQVGDQRLVAYYVPLADHPQAPDADTLRAHLAASLPGYMVPSTYVALDALPLTPNGKLDRKALPAPQADPARTYEPPQGPTEVLVASLFAEVLQVNQIGRGDNFFELGGHSLLAVQLIHKAAAKGLSLSVTDLFSEPTVAALSRRSSMQNPAPVTNSALLIRTGSEDSPLFFFHDGLGQLLYADVLARRLDSRISVYGLPAGPVESVTSTEQLVGRLVPFLRDRQPHGPYRLAGWSFGGQLAYEAAVQLTRVGESVSFLGLIDTVYRSSDSSSAQLPGEPDRLRNLLLADVQDQMQNSPARQEGLDTLQTLSYSLDLHSLIERCQQASLLPARFIDQSPAEIEAQLQREDYYDRLASQYRPPSIDNPVHLFLARETAAATVSGGWTTILDESQLRITEIDGDHNTMLQNPNVETLASALSRTLHPTLVHTNG